MTQISDNEQASTTPAPEAQGQPSTGPTPPWTPPHGQAPQWNPYQGQAPYGQPQYWPPQPPAGWQQGPYPYPVAQPYFVPVPQPVSRPTSGTAIFALIMSLLWLGGIGSILGLILGITSAKECDRTGEPGHGIATAAAILGFFGLLLMFVAIASS